MNPHLVNVVLSGFGSTFVIIGVVRSIYYVPVGWKRARISSFWGMLGWSLALIGDIMVHSPWVYVDTAFLAMNAYIWWNSGGGDGLKNKINSFVQKVTPKSPVLAYNN